MSRAFQLEAVILAGGQGSRMGGCDKGLVALGPRPLVEWTVETVRPLVERLIISCNRNEPRYRLLADAVVSDQLAGFPGPLAGIQSALDIARGSHLLILPCDTPWVSRELLQQLAAEARKHPDAIVVTEQGGRLEPLHAVIPVAYAASLTDYLQSGQRAVRRWYQQYPIRMVSACDQQQLANINTPQELVLPAQDQRLDS